jgi:translation initiation factor 3 subunit I
MPSTERQELLQEFVGHTGRITRAVWGQLNRTLISTGEDGTIRLWDVETGKQLAESAEHKKQVNDLTLSADGTHFVTGSSDKTAKLFDAQTLECMRTFQPERPVNAVTLSPMFEHVILGGGQEAMSVTLTSSKAGKFETKIYHKVFGDEIGGIKGHFGPVNALAVSPDGRSFTSGGEDGFVRINHFDADYFRLKNA